MKTSHNPNMSSSNAVTGMAGTALYSRRIAVAWRHLTLGLGISMCIALATASNVAYPAASDSVPAARPVPGTDIPLPAGVRFVTSVEGINEYTLENGLRVLLLPEATRPTTTVNLTVRVGSRHENYGETGMAHLLEHLLFKGSPRHPQVWSEFTKRGLRANGTTSFDRTNYFASFSENEENLDWYIGWLADAMVNSNIARADLDSEMTVVRNEMERNENSPGRILWEKVIATAYQWHNYGKATIGARSDVENVSIANLQAFYRKYYQPDNAVLVVSGKFDVARTLATIGKNFGSIARPTRVLTPTYTLDPVQDGERTVTLRRNGGTPEVMVAYHAPPVAHPDFVALRLAVQALGGANGRLHKALVETGEATSTSAFSLGLEEPGTVYFGADMRADQDPQKVRDLLLKVVENVANEPIKSDELERVRTALLNSYERQALDVGRLGVALSEAIGTGDWRLYFLNRDRVRAARLEDINRVASAWLLPASRTVGLYIPTATPRRAPAPERVDVAAMVRDYRGDAVTASGESFDPTPANIEARTERGKTTAGINYALLPKTTRGNLANVVLQFGMGDEKSLLDRVRAGSAMGALLGRGTARRSREALQTEFDRLRATWGVAGAVHGLSVSLQAPRENLSAALALIAEALREPNFSENEFEQIRNATIAALEGQIGEPEAILGNALDRHGNPYPKGDTRYVPTLPESIADARAMTLAEARAFYEEFYGGQAALVAAVGDFDAVTLKSDVDRLFGNWAPKRPYTRIPQPYYEIPPVSLRFDTPDKSNALLQGTLSIPMRDTDEDYVPLMVANRMFGAGGSSRLWNSIRERQGLSYSVYSYLSGGMFNANMGWGLGAIFAPANRERVMQSVREELTRALRDGFTATELEEARRGLLQSRRLSRTQDGGLAQLFAILIERGQTMQLSADIDRKIETVTLDQVNAAFRKYIQPEKLILGVAGDFSGQP